MTTPIGIKWLGLGAENIDRSVRFYSEALGLALVHATQGTNYALFRLPSGQEVELVGRESRWAAFHTEPVIGFEVRDLEGWRRKMETHGIQFVSEIVEARDWGRFCYFLGPDGRYFELVCRDAASYCGGSEGLLGYSVITCYVRDISAAAELFSTVFGLHRHGDESEEKAVFRFPAGELLVVRASSGSSPEPLSARSGVIRFDAACAKGLRQILFANEIQPLVSLEPGDSTWKIRVLDPDGNILELAVSRGAGLGRDI